MLASGHEGHIVNVSSLGGLLATETLGVYATSKFAVTGLTEAPAKNLKDSRIGVSVFLPGLVQSNIDEAAKGRPKHLAATNHNRSALGQPKRPVRRR